MAEIPFLFEVLCDECGGDLKCNVDGLSIYAKPCQTCLGVYGDKSRDDGFDNGYEAGYKAGEDAE